MDLRLKGFKYGDDLTLLNTYKRSITDEDGKYRELITLIFRDNKTGIKHVEEIVDPKYEYFTIKEEFQEATPQLFVEEYKANSHTVLNKYLARDIAEKVDLLPWFKSYLQAGDKDETRKVHMHPAVLRSDKNLEDFYRFWFGQHYTNNVYVPSKMYFDIEVDVIDIAGDFPEPGEAPINVSTVVFQDSMEVYTFVLREPSNPQVAELEEYIQTNGPGMISQFVTNHVSSQREFENDVTLGVEEFTYNVFFYDKDKEIDLITDMFSIINYYKPDFGMAWNIAFDIKYIIARIEALGHDPKDIICHPDFEYKFVEYTIDERAAVPEERGDFATISSYTVYIDQLIQFASRRKGQNKYVSFSLDYIAQAISNVGKLDYKHITVDFKQFAYKDFKTFFLYNICDTIAQYCVETVVEDIDYVFGKSIINNTRYSKIHRQTVYLANRGMKEFHNEGLIIGNNVNFANPKPEEKFAGAFVADPLKVSDYACMNINGIPIKVYETTVDFDYTALYPSCTMQGNITGFTQIGKLNIDAVLHEHQNRLKSKNWSLGGQFIEDLHSHNYLEVGCRYFNLPTFKELVFGFIDIFTNRITPANTRFRFKNSVGKEIFPIVDRRDMRPIIFLDEMSDQLKTKIKEWRNHVERKPNQKF